MRLRWTLTLIAAIALVLPPAPAAHAQECTTYYNNTPLYFPDACNCDACQYSEGSLCTQCYDIGTGETCTTRLTYCKLNKTPE